MPDREALLPEVQSALLARADMSHEMEALVDTCAAAHALRVETQDDNVAAADLIGRLRKSGRAIEAIKAQVKAPAMAVLNAVDAVFRDVAVTRDGAERALQARMGEWARLQAEEAAKKDAEEAARRQVEEAARKAAEPASEPLPPEVPAVAVAEPEPVRAANATSRTKTVRVFVEVADIAAIPSEFVKVDVAAINRALARGVDVPGINTREEVQVKVRAR